MKTKKLSWYENKKGHTVGMLYLILGKMIKDGYAEFPIEQVINEIKSSKLIGIRITTLDKKILLFPEKKEQKND